MIKFDCNVFITITKIMKKNNRLFVLRMINKKLLNKMKV